MINNIIGKKIGDISLDSVKKYIEESGEPTPIVKERLDSIEQAMGLKLPGKPDEIWRRVDFGGLRLKDYNIAEPEIKVGYLCEKHAKKEDFYAKSIEETIKERPELIDEFYRKLDEAKSIHEKNKDTVYTSDEDNTVFLAWSHSLFNGGIFVHVPKFKELKNTMKITVTVNEEGTVVIPSIFILMEEGSRANIVVEYHSACKKEALSLGMIRGVLSDGANLNILSYQDFDISTLSFQDRCFSLFNDSHLSYDFIQTGSKKSVTQHQHMLVGKGAEINMNGIVRASEDQFVGNKLGIHHYSPNTNSDFKSKSIIKDTSKVIFVGNIKMPQIAQKCDGRQSANNLLLGDKSEAEVIPRLEIIADEVRCSHGATVGSIDKESLFYLKSRGINPEEAENMIIKSYYQDILNNMATLKGQCCVYEYVTERLSKELDFEFDAFSDSVSEDC